MKKIPYGISDYRAIVENDYIYVDKTPYFQVMEDWGPTFLLFLRPRRFGKSLWISTLQYYYGIQYKKDFEKLFGKTAIGKNPTPRANQYMTLVFDFSGISTETEKGVFDGFLSKVIKGIDVFLEQYKYLFSSEEKKAILSAKSPHDVIDILFTFIEKKELKDTIYLIIDEYDHFANELISFNFNYFGEIVTKNGFVRKFYEVIKTATRNGVVDRIFMTGVSPITMDSLTSGFNIANNITLERTFHNLMGFEENDVEDILRKIDVSDEQLPLIINDMRLWYNGYWFNPNVKNKVYNPNMTLYFANSFANNQAYPDEMLDKNIATDYKKIKNLFNIQDKIAINTVILEDLLENGKVAATLTTQYSFEREFNQDDLVSLLFYMGFLSIESQDLDAYIFRFPNYVIKKLYADFFVEVMQERAKLPINNRPVNIAMREMATTGNPTLFFNEVSKVLQHFSVHDSAHFNENTLKAVIISLLHQQGFYYIHSEYETDWTYMDIFLEPIYGRKPKYEVAMELKYLAKGSKKQKETIFKEATTQLKDYLETPKFSIRPAVKSFVVVAVGNELEWREV